MAFLSLFLSNTYNTYTMYHFLLCMGSEKCQRENFQFRLELLLLLVGYVAEHVVHPMHYTALASRGGELLADRAQHGLIAVADLQVNRFDTPLASDLRAGLSTPAHFLDRPHEKPGLPARPLRQCLRWLE